LEDKTATQALDDQLVDLEPPYESDDEARIGRLLDQYGIPFFYKQATIIYVEGKNEILNPTFTLPQYGCVVIDYVPQEKQAAERIKIYRYNQIPATVLGPPHLDKPNWQESLYEKLQQETKQLEDLSFYRSIKATDM
jgi:hypothetical protein